MDNLIQVVSKFIGISPGTFRQLLLSAFIIILLWIGRVIFLKLALRGTDDPRKLYKWRKNSNYVVVVLGFFLVGRIWFEGIQSIATFLGLLSAGLAIALKDPITDLVAWLFIIWRRPIDMGDRIQVGDTRGDVIDLRLFKFTINEIGNWVDADQSTGRIIHVPNHRIFSDNIANYSSEFRFIWNEIPVLVTFESNWKKAKEILTEIIKIHTRDMTIDAQKQVLQAARSYMIYYNVLTPIVYTTVKDSGVMLTIRYITDPRRRRTTQEKIWEDILTHFSEEDSIDFAYPTTRIYYNPNEGKPGTVPKDKTN
ncbi:MAG TPA: mechanosensitive ion channel domain-containing protein [Balneolales bacterium]|nr:mechanosensitive ion channel domain-containing protein [Balneolales bacterium]